jgi:serine/threonine-protein kinase
LLDFGIAKVAGQDGSNNLTRTGTIFGTPYYMAPEQALGQAIDARVDVYAMGVIMYEVFSGSLPFRGESFMGILTQHITTGPEPIEQRAAKAGKTPPAGMPEIIARCLAKDPDKRFRTMEELVNVLIGVYRTLQGPGSYLGAVAPKSALVPVSPRAGGSAMVPAVSAPMTPAVSAPMGYGVSQSPYAPGGGHAAESSQFAAPARSGRGGLIAVILVVLVVGGGVAAFLLSGGDKSKPVAAIDPVVAIDTRAAQVPVAAIDAGAGGVHAATRIDARRPDPRRPMDAGVIASVIVDADVAVATVPDAAVIADIPIDAAVIAVAEPATVMVNSFVRRAVVFQDGKRLGRVPQLVKVRPGEVFDIVVKARGFKEFKIAIDGHIERIDAVLEAVPGGNGTSPTPQVDCDANPLDPACAQ